VLVQIVVQRISSLKYLQRVRGYGLERIANANVILLYFTLVTLPFFLVDPLGGADVETSFITAVDFFNGCMMGRRHMTCEFAVVIFMCCILIDSHKLVRRVFLSALSFIARASIFPSSLVNRASAA
jgi:hypothetical protein